jgi:hypothetical protein
VPEKELKSEIFNWQPEQKPALPLQLYLEKLAIYENRQLEINNP